jgi:hypothetical protein
VCDGGFVVVASGRVVLKTGATKRVSMRGMTVAVVAPMTGRTVPVAVLTIRAGVPVAVLTTGVIAEVVVLTTGVIAVIVAGAVLVTAAVAVVAACRGVATVAAGGCLLIAVDVAFAVTWAAPDCRAPPSALAIGAANQTTETMTVITTLSTRAA